MSTLWHFRRGAVGFPSGGRVAGRARRDPFFQLFHMKHNLAFQLLFHPVSPPFCFRFKGSLLIVLTRERKGSWGLPARLRLRLATAGNFGAVAVAVAGTSPGRPAD